LRKSTTGATDLQKFDDEFHFGQTELLQYPMAIDMSPDVRPDPVKHFNRGVKLLVPLPCTRADRGSHA